MDAAQFAGDWTLEVVVVTRAHVPVLGDFLARSRSELAVRLDLKAGGLVQTQRVCSTIVNDGRGLVRTEVPAAFIAALPVVSFPAAVTEQNGIWSYASDFGRQVLGWDGVGFIPTDQADPRVRDSDGDGHPGLTVHIEAPFVGTGSVYVVQVGRTTVSGTWDGTAFSGAVAIPEFAQSVVGASTRALLNGPTVRPASELSTFRMTRAGPSCGPVPTPSSTPSFSG